MLRDRKNRIRLVLFILAVLIAVGSFTTWAIKLGHRESGYQTIVYENTHADVLYRTGISMIYWAEGNAADIRTLSNTVQRIYSGNGEYCGPEPASGGGNPDPGPAGRRTARRAGKDRRG